MAENQVFDVDALAEEYQPVVIRFRGQEYTLGTNVLQVIAAAELGEGVEKEEGMSGLRAIVTQLPAYLRTLCPEIGPALEESLTSTEEVALLRPITAVMNRFSDVSKSTENEAKRVDTGDGGAVPALLPPVQPAESD